MTISTQKPSTPNLFRSDIEGLRAVAILLVIGSHFSIPGMSAGFIGVDVFFVISGYLITAMLMRELAETSHIDLLRFYANRFRRLFPALAIVLAVSSIAAYLIFPPTHNLAQSKAASMAAVWLSNLHFAFTDVDYFSAETNTNVFLHTWSLGVEEQFYLLWPLLILLAVRLHRSKRTEPTLWILLLTVAAGSLSACLFLADTHPTIAYYLMPTRAWQFALGAITWLLMQRYPVSKHGSRLAGLAGGLLLIAAMLFIGPDNVYPSKLALLPTLASCALLYAGSWNGSITHGMLSQSYMQWVGRLSYTWYLWHWPILILGEHLFPIRGNPVNTIVAVGVSLLMSIATHYLIENPIRYGQAKKINPRWQISVALVAMILFNSQLLRWNTLTDESLANSTDDKYIKARHDLPLFYKDGCDEWHYSDRLNPCSYGDISAPQTAVLMGDSIGAQWFPTLTHMLNPEQWRIIVLTKSSCPMVDEPFFYGRIGREYTECSSWRDKAISWLKTYEPDAIFLGSTASNPFTDRQLKDGTRRILDQIAPHSRHIYVIESNPVLGFNGPGCILQNEGGDQEKCIRQQADGGAYTHVANVLKSVVSDYENISMLETASYVCPNGICKAEREGVVVFRDTQHLTATFTATAAKHFKQQIEGTSFRPINE